MIRLSSLLSSPRALLAKRLFMYLDQWGIFALYLILTVLLTLMSTNVCKPADCEFRNISLMRKYLDQTLCKILIHAFVTLKLDYINPLLFGLPDSQIQKLQKIQNTATQSVKREGRQCHSTPLLKDLH